MNVLIFSHRSDNDGVTPVILSKLVFDKVDFILEEPTTIDESFFNSYQSGLFDQYDYVFVTDLCLCHSLAQKIESDSKNKEKVLIFDHHYTNLDKNQYSFISVVDTQNGRKECGSSLYYQYLLEHFSNDILKKPVVQEMVELVRLLDTWTFDKESEEEAKWIGNLFDIYGKEYYIEYYYQFCLSEEHFFFDDVQQHLLKVEEVRIQNYITKKEQEIHPVMLHGYYVGVVFAEFYRSELGNFLAHKYQDVYDFIAVINISRSVSYRGVKDIDLGSFAKFYGGAGHKKAAGSGLPPMLLDDIIKLIFKEVMIEGDHSWN